MKNPQKQNKTGFSLIELLLVLGIIAALAIVAFIIYPKVSSASKAQTEISNINAIKASIDSLYASSPYYTNLDTETALNSKVFPSSMVSSDGSYVSSTFKGPVSVGSAGNSPSGSPNSSFVIAYVGIPADACIKIVSAVANSFYEVNVSAAGTSTASTLGNVVKGPNTPLNVSTLTTVCQAGGENNAMEFFSL